MPDRGVTVLPDPPSYFRIRTTGRVHYVREVSEVRRGGEAWVSIWFWCNNLGLGSAGDFLVRLSCSALVCTRCADSSQHPSRGNPGVPRPRSRWDAPR